MLNNEKIRVMTKLSIYENKSGKEDIKLSQYYKTDYVRLQILNTLVFVTIGYMLLLVMIGAYQSEYLIKEAVNLDYEAIGTYIIGIYVMILTIYILGVVIGYNIKYETSKKKLLGYSKGLKYLQKLYDEEDKQRGTDK